MPKYGFQGVDLDWEYPVSPDRGGTPDDTQNLVLLVQEMRKAFGTNYGISLTLAPDYWYLRYFDAKSMESSVDFFGFMAYGKWTQRCDTPRERLFRCFHGWLISFFFRSARSLGHKPENNSARCSWPGRHP